MDGKKAEEIKNEEETKKGEKQDIHYISEAKKKIIEEQLSNKNNFAGVNPGEIIPSKFEAPEGFTNEKIIVKDKSDNGNELSVPVEHLYPTENKNDRVIIQIHGGAYLFKLNDLNRLLAAKYSKIAGGADVFSIDYRTAPVDKYPAGLEDSVAVYKYLLAKGYKNDKIIIIGDSSGGHLAITTILYLRDKGIPLPKGVIALSPWTNIMNDFDSIVSNSERDMATRNANLLSKDVCPLYFEGQDRKNDPLISPCRGNFKGFPKFLIQCGGNDILLDDSREIAKKAKNDGADVKFTIYNGMPHVFQVLLKDIEEVDNAFKEIKNFIDENI